jgi:hypothetical protein
MNAGASSSSARPTLATSAYLLVVGAVTLGLAISGHPDLLPGWFGFAGIGGLGGVIKGQLTDVARTVGTQHLENGSSIAQIVEQTKTLETYTHERMHELANGLTVIKGALVLAGIPVEGMPAPPSSSTLPPPPAART